MPQLLSSAYTPPHPLCALLSCSGYQVSRTQKADGFLRQRKACVFGRGLCAEVALVRSPSRAPPAPGWRPSATPVPLLASCIFLVLGPCQPVRPCLPYLLSLPGVNRWLAVTHFLSRKSSLWQPFPTSTFFKLVLFSATTAWFSTSCLPRPRE